MKKRLKRMVLYCIPLVLEVIIHIVASFFTERAGDNTQWRIIMAAIMTLIYMLLGEGYGSLAFIVAGFVDHIIAYVLVIIMSVIGIGANFVGFIVKGTEGDQCFWMTAVFWFIDLFLIVFSVIRITQLRVKKKNMEESNDEGV